MNPTQELTVIDEDDEYGFAIAPGEDGGKLFTVQNQLIESFDKTKQWRTAIHPWQAGLSANRISPAVTFSGDLRNRPAMVYAKANGDASNPNYFTAPPKYNVLGSNITTLFYNTAAQLAYGGFAYGTFTYIGAASSSSDITKVIRNFNGKAYFGGGQYLYSLDASYTLSTVKDFGAGKIVHDIERFGNELIIAMGESDKIWTMTTGEIFTQASDNVYAIALGTVDDQLWRAASINQVSNCISSPRTLSSWVPADDEEYRVGDSTYPITDLLEYGGVIVAIKPDGVYFPDAESAFHNQTPQLADYPHTDNGRGAFRGWGYLWIPSVSGLLRVTVGESISVGPELSGRPDFRFAVRAGIEWNGDIYLVCTDEADIEPTFICKMMKDHEGIAQGPYIYHEWLRFDNADPSYMITVFTTPTNPTMIAGHGSGIHYWLMGRGSGISVDDANYEFGTEYELDSGDFIATEDRGMKVSLTSVKIIGRQPENATLRVQYAMDGEPTFHDFLDSYEGGGTNLITESGFFNRTLYAPTDVYGNVLRIKITGTLPPGTLSPNRPEIYEIWAFGNVLTEETDIVTVGIYADQNYRIRGLRQRIENTVYDLFRLWSSQQKMLTLRIPGYDPLHTARFVVIDVNESSVNMLKSGNQQIPSNVVKVVLRRVYFEDTLHG